MLLLVLLLCALGWGQLYIDTNGTLGVVGTFLLNTNTLVENVTVMNVSNTTNSTQTTTVLASQFNLLEELKALRAELHSQQQQLEQLRQKSACSWQGMRCQCFYKFSASLDDYLVLLGSNCTDGQLVEVRILNMLVASQINGCLFNTTEICDETIP